MRMQCDSQKARTDTMGRPGHPPTAMNLTFMEGEPEMGMGAGQRKRARALVSVAVPKGEARTFVILG